MALTKVVGRAVPFQFTTAPGVKPVPFTVSENAGPPAVVEAGFKDVIDGPGTILKVTGAEVTPPLTAVIEAVPWLAMRLAATVAVS